MMNVSLRRALAPAAVWLAAATAAYAQQPPAPSQQNPVCARLESQLQNFDRSAGDPARADQIRKYQEAAASQQNEIERQEATSRRLGCESNSFFQLFSGQSQQCGPLNTKIQQMRANLDRIMSDLERLQQGAGAPERDGQRRAILVALSRNNCGAQYRAAASAPPPQRGGGLFETLFGPGSVFSPGESGASAGFSAPGGTYRTICVRTCDGFFYPISFATNSSRFAEDEKTCQRSCPASEVMLFSHRNPGEDVNQAVSTTTGQPYTSLPNAFKYRQAWDNGCSCRRPGETWAQALKNVDDTTVEQGDIVVNEQRARQLSQPRTDSQGRPIRPDRAATRPAPNAPAAQGGPAAGTQSSSGAGASTAEPVKPDPNRSVRAVGPTFIPTR